jgi:hypothetical protein
VDWYKNNKRGPVDGYDDPDIKNLVDSKGSDKNRKGTIIGASVGGTVSLAALLVLFFLIWRIRRRTGRPTQTSTANAQPVGDRSAVGGVEAFEMSEDQGLVEIGVGY